MKYILHNLDIEVTRRCNLRCEHCMRGESQNININKDYIDVLLDNPEIKQIDKILFTGGEPTLNPEIIIYTINKIINNNLNVLSLAMVTNGIIYNDELVKAFYRFNEFRNNKIKKVITKRYINLDKEQVDKILKDNSKHVRITFSTDNFHAPLKDDIKNNYLKYNDNFIINEFAIEEDEVYQTGLSTYGKEFTYRLKDINYSSKDNETYTIQGELYLTSTGYLTSEGSGEYNDMDIINLGHINNIKFKDVLTKYGKPLFGTKEISSKKL